MDYIIFPAVVVYSAILHTLVGTDRTYVIGGLVLQRGTQETAAKVGKINSFSKSICFLHVLKSCLLCLLSRWNYIWYSSRKTLSNAFKLLPLILGFGSSHPACLLSETNLLYLIIVTTACHRRHTG